MPRLAIKTPKGELVAEHQVAAAQVVAVLHGWFGLLTSSDIVVTVDGARVTEEDKRRILELDITPPSPSPELPAPAVIADYASTIHHAFEQIRDAEWKTTERLQAYTAKFADELARQRQLMHQCIRDVDSVDRAIVATNQADRFATRIQSAANAGANSKATINITDMLHGIREVMNNYGGAPNEQK